MKVTPPTMTDPVLHNDCVSSIHYVQVESPRQSINNTSNVSTIIDTSKRNDDTTASSSSIAFFELYRFATTVDLIIIALGVVAAALNGALFPCMALVFGSAIAAFTPFDQSAVNDAALEFFYIAIALFITDFAAYVCFAYTAERQMKALREQTLDHLLHLDLAWFDQNNQDLLQFASRITGDTEQIKQGMGQKCGDAIKFIGQFVAGYVIGFVKLWDLALVMCCVTPLSVLTLSYLLDSLRILAVQSQQLYADADAIAEEALSAMRTVASLNAEAHAIANYNSKTATVERTKIAFFKKAAAINGVFSGSLWLMYAVGLWYGGKKVYENDATPQAVMQTFFGLLLGTMSIGQISPNISAIAEARGTAARMFAILAIPSTISTRSKPSSGSTGDNHEATGMIPMSCVGTIEAIDLRFAYPSRPEALILNGYSLTIQSGEKVALVGPSGGGKSTLIALLERFYDPQCGELRLDGCNIQNLNVQWLRQQIGVVSQEPVLFHTTLFENIAAGIAHHRRTSDPIIEQIIQEKVVAAAQMANAHEFIMALPQQYNTLVGGGGNNGSTALSGGQKQRIAIARALIREPKILILDEATSALDAASESMVQETLDALMVTTKMTTIMIAHRLSAVRKAGKIVVIDAGKVVEMGVHETLMQIQDGVYHKLYTMQQQEQQHEHQDVVVVDADEKLQVVEKQVKYIEQVNECAPLDLELQQDSLSASTHLLRSSIPILVSTSELDGPDEDLNTKMQPIPVTKFTVHDAMALSRPESWYFFTGMAVAAVHGLGLPISAIFISELVATMSAEYAEFQASDNNEMDVLHLQEKLKPTVITVGALYIVGAFALCFLHGTQIYCFRYMAEKLTFRLQDMHFRALMKQNIGFFDIQPYNAASKLSSELAMFAAKVSLISGDSQGRMLQAIVTLIAAIAISFASGSWLLTLMILAVFPLIITGEVIRARHMKHSGSRCGWSEKDLSIAGAHAAEALSNIYTIAALGLEKQWGAKFAELLGKLLRRGQQEARTNGVAVGFSSFIMFAVYALVFWYGGVLVHKGDITFHQLLRSLMTVMMSSQGLGFAVAWLLETDHALEAGAAIFALRDRQHPIIEAAMNNSDQVSMDIKGKLEFQDVMFAYPTRPSMTVLNNFTLTIEAGQTVAFCGPSDGGKSTVFALIERFYDPVHGRVLLDGHDLTTLDLKWLRSQIGLVAQEPTLFLGTIAENIAYGLLDSEKSISALRNRQRIEQAAKRANAHAFIMALPDGYATQVGMKGSQLSGGQKQRIALARAIVRNPRILLLDEATSGLDAVNERIVQEALNQVIDSRRHCSSNGCSTQKRPTTLIIGHRLSTIRNADKICVISENNIAEQGTHQELLSRNGIYTRLVQTDAGEPTTTVSRQVIAAKSIEAS